MLHPVHSTSGRSRRALKLSRRLGAFVLAAAACLVPALAAHTAAARDEVRRTPAEARARQDGEEVFITEMELARDDGAGRGGQVVKGFRTTDNPLHCLVTLSRAREGTRVRFVWTALDAGGKTAETLATSEVVTRPGEIVADGQLRLPRPWPAGRYRVQAAVNGRAPRAINFQIN